jgi:anti-anti-sigma factor
MGSIGITRAAAKGNRNRQAEPQTAFDLRLAAAKKEKEMQISTEEMAGGITRIALDGRLDIAGASAVDLKMNVIAGSASRLLIDLEKVSFLGSMGLRSIVLPARAVHGRGGKVVLLKPVEMVESVLKSSGIDTLLPIYHDLPAALAALQ